MNIIEKLERLLSFNDGVTASDFRDKSHVISADDLRAIIEEYKKQEPFGYFKAEPFGWTDCAETDEGAIALYENPPLSDETVKDGYVMVPRKPTPEMINAGVMVDRKAWEFGIEHYDRTRSTEALVHNLNRCTDAYKAMIDEAMKADK